MKVLEIPLGKRSKFYRFFEMLPGLISIGGIVLLVVLSIFAPVAASIFMLCLVLLMFVRAVGMAYRTVQGYQLYKKSCTVAWDKRLKNLSEPEVALGKIEKTDKKLYAIKVHEQNLQRILANPDGFPSVDEIIHGVFIFIYNEGYDVLRPTLEAIKANHYDMKKVVIVLAYEERGGQAAKDTVDAIVRDYTGVFADILPIEHPQGLPNEIVGKGPNATYAGEKFTEYVRGRKIDPENVIVTTLDSDNRMEPNYLPYLTYEWIVAPNRQKLSYQPICLFTNNIWDVPAPMRVVAVGNSFWNIVSSTRPHLLRNFASHSQGLQALIDMNYWSKRTIVEDGHQYWRSYFHFDGDYSVVPLKVAIGQDAVLSDTYWKTLKAQFVQVRRWAYGASDVAYVAESIRLRGKKVKFWPAFTRLIRLLDNHTSQAVMAPLIAFGGWIPLIVAPLSPVVLTVHELPMLLGQVQMVAVFGILTTMFTSFLLLPPKPVEHHGVKRLLMALQWILMPVTSIIYTSASAYYSQTRLLFARYMTVFDVTQKTVKGKKAK